MTLKCKILTSWSRRSALLDWNDWEYRQSQRIHHQKSIGMGRRADCLRFDSNHTATSNIHRNSLLAIGYIKAVKLSVYKLLTNLRETHENLKIYLYLFLRLQGYYTSTLRAETFAGIIFRVSKKTRNIWQKLSRLVIFGIYFAEKTFANLK